MKLEFNWDNTLKWLIPGMRIKRWLLLLIVGVVIISLGFAYFLRQVYESYTFPNIVYYVTLQFVDRYVRGVIFVLGGVGLVGTAILRLNRSLLSAFVPEGREDDLVDLIYFQRYLRRGPKVVAIGGGTGLSILLRGLKEHTGNLTAVVTVADDGGSSGRLRRELGVLPPGDFRNCIAALADAEPLMTKLLQYRFNGGSGLEGHSFGNLFIVAMSGVTGNFEQALRESSRVLAVRGQILPSTLADVQLCARMEDEDVVQGESNITHSPQKIKRAFLEPADVQAHPDAIRAILDADLIVLGPGSLFTSILPNLLVDGIQKAIRASSAVKVYVCNVATQPGETDEFTVGDHVEALESHVGPAIFQYVIVNDNINFETPADPAVTPVALDGFNKPDIKLVATDVVSTESRLRHDSKKLAAAVMKVYGRRAKN
ncbi:MAG: YvcK family protein [Dehalococcoidia bacterium]|nr:YvcK family protein [Dehalococcoidia bacterium]